jgi:LPS-assembly protein
MKNKIIYICLTIFFFNFFILKSYSKDQFIFNIGEINISQNGQILSGNKRGTIITDKNVTIESDNFTYDKVLNRLNLSGKVIVDDPKNELLIFSENITYYKDEEKIFSKGNTKTLIKKNFEFNSSDVIFEKEKKILLSKKKTTVKDDLKNLYEAEIFKYYLDSQILKGKNIKLTYSNLSNEKNSDTFFFKDAFINLKNKNFSASESFFKFHKDIFNRSKNDPRLFAISTVKKGNITQLNKALFTSCNKDAKCPAWSIQADKITHDKEKKQLIYNNALLKVYDVPVLYFPKFFHPDPTVKRQSGFLQPFLNKSNLLGSSLQMPYYKVLSDNRDLTFKPTFFKNKTTILQTEFRQINKNSSITADFGHTRGYDSKINSNKKNISHLFAKFYHDFSYPGYTKSNLNLRFEKTNNDTYLKVFNGNLADTINLPDNSDTLNSEFKIELLREKDSFLLSMNIFEELSGSKSDRYQYIFPRYEYNRNFNDISRLGYLNIKFSGDNNLKNTNNLTSRIINDFNFKTYDYFADNGLVNNMGIYLKNLNTVAKNDEIYKSNPQILLMSTAEYNLSYPLIKTNESFINRINPKISFKISPNEMKNYSREDRNINFNNIFEIDRLGLMDTFETGESLTVGFEYKKENLKNINNYFQFNVATVFRDKEDNDIPNTTTLNKKQSNYFGSFNANLDDYFNIGYDFSINDQLNQLEYASVNLGLKKNNFYTKINYLEENANLGEENVLENSFGYNFNENNVMEFKTRRNRKLNLTEFYDLMYEYKNDCLTAAIKYNKSFYSDRDLKPSEDIMFTLTFFPITKIEQKMDKNF